jgi:hypothetical protein
MQKNTNFELLFQIKRVQFIFVNVKIIQTNLISKLLFTLNVSRELELSFFIAM